MNTRSLLLLFALLQDGTVKKLLAQADGLYAKRAEAGMAEQAVETYKKVLAIDSSNDEAYWKIARADFWIGSHVKDGEAKAKIFKDGIEYAKLGIAVNPDSLPGHYWLGVSYAVFGDAKGIGQSLNLVDPIKEEMEWIIKQDERFLGGSAHRLLGRLYFLLPGIAGGDNDKAVEHLKKSIEIQPVNPLSRLFLADVYIAKRKNEDAIRELRRVLGDPVDPEWEPETKEQQAEAKEKLKRLE